MKKIKTLYKTNAMFSVQILVKNKKLNPEKIFKALKLFVFFSIVHCEFANEKLINNEKFLRNEIGLHRVQY